MAESTLVTFYTLGNFTGTHSCFQTPQFLSAVVLTYYFQNYFNSYFLLYAIAITVIILWFITTSLYCPLVRLFT